MRTLQDSTRLDADRLDADDAAPPGAGTVDHLHQLALLFLAHVAQVVVGALEAADLVLDDGDAVDGADAVVAADQRADQLPAQGLEVDLEGLETAVVLHDQVLVADGPGPHVDQEQLVLLVLSQRGGVGADKFRPQRGEEVAFQPFLGVGLADHRALQVEELAVDGFEEGEEGGGVGELAVDGFFEYVEEFVEGAGEGDARSLGRGGAKDFRDQAAEEGRFATVFEEIATVEEAVDIVKD